MVRARNAVGARRSALAAGAAEKLPPPAAARAAGLRYVSDEGPGIHRKRAGKGFTFIDEEGRPVRDPETLTRLRHLAIPPAWTDVWICPFRDGHVQATGRDGRRRKQYLYHARWREVRDETKYHRMMAFAEALPRIRETVDEHLGRSGLPREKVLAAVVHLLDCTYIRVGNEEYARTNRSFGLTTLQCRHVNVNGSKIQFRFRGKSGKAHLVELHDRRTARLIRRCQELPGQELFQYVEDGEGRSVRSNDVNDYLREVSGQDFTAKDFRTWGGTVLAFLELHRMGACESRAQVKRNVSNAIKQVAERLGNTPAICRKCYVHPCVIQAYSEASPELLDYDPSRPSGTPGLEPEEAAAHSLLAAYGGEIHIRRLHFVG